MSKNGGVVLLVCTGNICRSPMAEYILRERLGPDSKWVVRSAGVFAGLGSQASHAAVQALDEWDIDLSPHRSNPLSTELINTASWIVVMAEHHGAEIVRLFPDVRDRVRLLTSFSPDAKIADVPDPIGGSINVYRTVRDLINSAISDLVLFLVDEQQ